MGDADESQVTARAAAFFDLDRTLLLENSGKLWFQRERAAGRISLAQLVEAALWLGLYKLGLMQPDLAFSRGAAAIVGEEEAVMVERTRAFFDEVVVPTIAPGARAAVAEHREQGEPTVLLSSTSPYLAEPAREAFGLDDVLCTRFEVVDGRFTGELVEICYGEGKVRMAERWAEENGVCLDRSTFYTDSITDLPMLERVGAPRIVQPDTRLARLARKRDWPVLDWSGADEEPPEAGGGPSAGETDEGPSYNVRS